MSSHKLTIKPHSEVLDLNEIHLSKDNSNKIDQLIGEFNFLEALSKYKLSVDNKVLLHGATGCGKTATANAIAKSLNKKVVMLNLGSFVSSKLGETARNITSVFTSARLESAILFIDEFDFIGKSRDYDNKDSGEMKRVVNVLLQQIDNLDAKTLLICATNHIESIDTALVRRFQLKLEYNKPTKEQLDSYYDRLLKQFPKEILTFKLKYSISYAEAKDFIFQNIKRKIIEIEKQKMQFLFSYGTLQLENVQKETYGRILKGIDDRLLGFKLVELQINDKSVIAKSNKSLHPIAIKTDNTEDYIEGKVFKISTQELFNTDLYEVNDYKRVLETFQSGIKAWVYIKK